MLSTMYYNHLELDIDAFIDDPEHHLFIYCLLTKKAELAKLFLQEGKVKNK
jgi:hypothetical protein